MSWCAHCEEPVTGNAVTVYGDQEAHQACHERHKRRKNN